MTRQAPSQNRMYLWLAVALCTACGSATPTTTQRRAPESASLETEGEPAEVADSRQVPAEVATTCEGVAQPQCVDRAGCVFDEHCRDARNQCERLRPVHNVVDNVVDSAVSTQEGPCMGQNRACVLNNSGFCTPFVAQSECPASREQVNSAPIYCRHPEQPRLDCPYDGGWCSCQQALQCGGGIYNPGRRAPTPHWTCVDDTDDRGCPTRPIREGTRCRLDASLVCPQGCSDLYQCVRRRWRITGRSPGRSGRL